MPDVYTDPQGRRRPISKRRGWLTAAVAAGVIAAAGGGSAVGGAAAAGGSGSGLGGKGLHARTDSGKQAARKGRYDQAWRRMRLRSMRKRIEHELDCVAHSYGQVRQLLIRTPCRSLHRALLAVEDGHGTTIVVSIAWVQMPTAASARNLRQLEDTYGTGDVSPLGGAELGLAGIHFTGHHYASRRARTLVVIAETEPLTGRPTPQVLKAVAEIAAEFPPP